MVELTSFHTDAWILAGVEAMHGIKKEQMD